MLGSHSRWWCLELRGLSLTFKAALRQQTWPLRTVGSLFPPSWTYSSPTLSLTALSLAQGVATGKQSGNTSCLSSPFTSYPTGLHAEYNFKDKTIDNSRVTNFRFSYKALSSSEHRTLRDNYTGHKHLKISSARMDENWPSSRTKSSVFHLPPSSK